MSSSYENYLTKKSRGDNKQEHKLPLFLFLTLLYNFIFENEDDIINIT